MLIKLGESDDEVIGLFEVARVISPNRETNFNCFDDARVLLIFCNQPLSRQHNEHEQLQDVHYALHSRSSLCSCHVRMHHFTHSLMTVLKCCDEVTILDRISSRHTCTLHGNLRYFFPYHIENIKILILNSIHSCRSIVLVPV